MDGISAGLFADGKDSYVGRGTVNGQLAPGTLLIEDSISRKAGLYMEYGQVENFITSDVEYYVKNPVCNYEWIASSNGETIVNAIAHKSDGFTFYVGRIFDENSWYVGKILIEHQVMYFGNGKQTASYEVLVCRTTLATATERKFS